MSAAVSEETIVTEVSLHSYFKRETHLFRMARELEDTLILFRHLHPCGPPTNSTADFAVPFKHVLETTWAEVGWIMIGIVKSKQSAKDFNVTVVSVPVSLLTVNITITGFYSCGMSLFRRTTTLPSSHPKTLMARLFCRSTLGISLKCVRKF